MLTENFIIENRIGEIPVLAEKIELLAEKWNFPEPLPMNLNLVVEEALTNIIFYGFHDDKIHRIKISFSLNNMLLTIRITDDGVAFNPTSRPKPDVTLSAIDRPVGGLGIFLISKMMDDVRYARRNNRNTLTLKKEIRYEHTERKN
jgi:serine/threonine-protein kinase RsbW